MGSLFVGRRAELDLLAAEWKWAQGGRPRVVLVNGPAGIGKTALLNRFFEEHPEALGLKTDGDEAEADVAFGTLERLVAGFSDRFADYLTDVVAGRAPAPAPITVGVELLSFFDALQDGGPVVIALDDAQWADRPSLAALTFALRRLRNDHVLALIAVREAAEASLPAGLVRLGADERGSRLTLGGLDVLELQALSAAAGPGEMSAHAASRLHEHTEGNPLYASTLLRELGINALVGDGVLPAPPSFSLLILASLSNCSEDALRLVQAAAVLGRRCALGVAAGVAELDEQVLGALQEAIEAGLLVEEDGRGTIAFAHPLVHSAVYSDLGPASRSRLHTRAAGFLTGEAALTHRVKAASAHDRELAQELRDLARQENDRGAWRAAARHLMAAAGLDPDPSVREDCLLEAGMLIVVGLDVAAVHPLADDISALPPSCRRDYVLGHMALGAGRVSEAAAHFQDALAACDPERDLEVAAACTAWAARCALFEGRGAEAVEGAQRALGLGPPSSHASAIAKVTLAMGMAFSGRAREALATEFGEDAGPGPSGFDDLTGRGILRLWTDDVLGAVQDLSAAEAFIAREGPMPNMYPALIHLAEAEYRAGRWDDAVAHAYHAVSLGTDADSVYAASFARATLAFLHALRGEYDTAQEQIAVLRAGASTTGDPSIGPYVCRAAAYLALARGDPAGVVEALAPLAERPDRGAVCEPGIVPWRDLHVEALVRLGRLEEAEEGLVWLESLAAERKLDSALAAAARARGVLEAARGSKKGAREALEEGLARASELDMPFLQGLGALELGGFLRRAGQRRAAAARLEEAAGLFGGLRADPFVERCEQELEICGLSPSSKGTGHLNLTPQEIAIARLVARGLTNRAVASELVLSVKTIEYHLSNLYSKVGVSSRAQLVARLGTDDDRRGESIDR